MKHTVLKQLKESGVNVPDFVVLKSPDDEVILDANKRYAIRSSCHVEDSKDYSFAGLFDTYLNVEVNDVPAKIKACFMSVNNQEVLDYMAVNHLDLGPLEMSVIVQEMVDSELSGVLFTSNPKGLVNESVIIVGRGLGEGIVSDQVETTAYYYHLTDEVYYYEGSEDLLNKGQVEELILEGQKLVKTLDSQYLDIEFAFYQGALHVLQARPITTLEDKQLLIMDNSNIVESYPGVSLPLTDSFVQFVYSGVFKGLAYRVLRNNQLLERHSQVFKEMVGSVNGRMYYKISNWYTVIKFLPMNHKIIPVWQEMLGVSNKVYNNESLGLTPFDRFRTYINSAIAFIKVPKQMKALEDQFDVVKAHFDDYYNESLSTEELLTLYGEIRDKLLAIWDVTLLNDMYAFVYTGLLKSRVKKKTGENVDQITNELISGFTNIESMKPVKELIRLADIKDRHGESEVFDQLRAEYIETYGDRALEELKLESKTYRIHPNLLDETIDGYLEDKEKFADMKRLISPSYDTKKNKRKSIGLLASIFRKKAELGIRNREVSRLNRTRIYGMVRRLFIGFGYRFAEEGYIENHEDIYYLTTEEVFDMVATPVDQRLLISDRKESYKLYDLLPAYTRLQFLGDSFDKSHQSVNQVEKNTRHNQLAGVPCSNGKVQGEVLIIHNPEDAKDVSDKILVTKMTDPGWVFLLATAKGVIAEKGSLLSHTAIVSRELNIPSIVGVKGALTTLKSGDIITMDGSTGIIEVIS